MTHEPRNVSKVNTIASKALRHNPNNNTTLSQKYTIVNFRRREQSYDQAEPFCIFDEN